MTENEQPQIQPEEQNNNNQEQEADISPPEDISQDQPIKRIFNYERVDKSKKYFLNQSPPEEQEIFLDDKFPINTSSLLDKSKKSTGVDKININEIDWNRASEIFKENISLFPSKREEEEYHKFKINFRNNKGELFSNYTQFFHGISTYFYSEFNRKYFRI